MSVPGPLQGNKQLPGTNTIIKPNFGSDKYIVRQGTYNGARLEIQVNGSLKADTKYIAYFVLQGGTPESISPQVFAFRFQTEKATRPIISVSLNNPSAMIESDRAAKGRYMMVVAGREGDILNTPMRSIWNAAAEAEYPDIVAKVKDMTVLEAMKEKVHVGDNHVGSAFDIFATEDGRNTVTGWFNSASTDGSTIVKVGTTSLPANQMVNINCQNDMVEGNQEYWFIAMGKSALGSSAAFAAECYLFYPVKNPPKVTEVGTTVESNVTDVYGDAVRWGYSGTVRIVFDSYLYQNKDNKFLQVVDKPLTATTIDSKKHVCSGALLESTTKVAIVPSVKAESTDNPYCQSLLLQFTSVKVGETIVFSQSLANNRGYTSNDPLTLKMTLVKNEYGFFMPEFVITSTKWDATVKN